MTTEISFWMIFFFRKNKIESSNIYEKKRFAIKQAHIGRAVPYIEKSVPSSPNFQSEKKTTKIKNKAKRSNTHAPRRTRSMPSPPPPAGSRTGRQPDRQLVSQPVSAFCLTHTTQMPWCNSRNENEKPIINNRAKRYECTTNATR